MSEEDWINWLLCDACGDPFCGGNCPQAWEEYERQERAIAHHVANCTKDGFCYTCQCL